MTEPASTTKIRLVAQDVISQQERVCDARRDSQDEKLAALAEQTKANAEAIAELTKTVAVMASTIKPLPEAIKEGEEEIDTLKDQVTKISQRPAFWAAAGAALPVLAGVLWDLFVK